MNLVWADTELLAIHKYKIQPGMLIAGNSPKKVILPALPSADVDAENKGGLAALIWAAALGHEAVLRLLLDHGADVDAKNKGQEAAMRLLYDCSLAHS